jgi:hypothetical protein
MKLKTAVSPTLFLILIPTKQQQLQPVIGRQTILTAQLTNPLINNLYNHAKLPICFYKST